jgi:hypothetical protein
MVSSDYAVAGGYALLVTGLGIILTGLIPGCNGRIDNFHAGLAAQSAAEVFGEPGGFGFLSWRAHISREITNL